MRSLLVVTAWFCAFAAAAGCSRTPGPARPEGPSVDLERAALPFKILEVPGGREISWEEFSQRAREASAVCIGEQHSNPHHHWAQLQVVEALIPEGDAAGAALGMEMFQRPFQGVLNDFASGRIDEATMLSRTGWENRWGFDYGLYRPIVNAALGRGAALVALNAPREIVRKVSGEGLGALTPSQRESLPELDLDDDEHQAWFWEVMEQVGHAHGHNGGDTAGAGGAGEHGEHEGHTGGGRHEHGNDHGGAAEGRGDGGDEAMSARDRLYAAQVIWDESMAEAAADWLAGGEGRRIVLLAGNGHCHESAIARRIERRGHYEAASIRPILDVSDGRVAEHLVDPRHDFLFVMTPQEGDAH